MSDSVTKGRNNLVEQRITDRRPSHLLLTAHMCCWQQEAGGWFRYSAAGQGRSRLEIPFLLWKGSQSDHPFSS